MLNEMIIVKENGKTAYFSTPYEAVEAIVKIFEGDEIKVVKAGRMEFSDLPTEIQEEVIDTLSCYDHTFVTFKNGQFTECPSIGISSSYPVDHFSCGEYFAKDFYKSEAERRAHAEADTARALAELGI